MRTRRESPLREARSVRQFISSAQGYCGTIERVETLTVAELLRDCEPALVRLYIAALSLPAVEPSTTKAGRRLGHKRWKALYDVIGQKLGPHNIYYEVFDPSDPQDHKSISHTLSDDLADIYLDLKPGLEDWPKANKAKVADIVWDWRFGFQTHWGKHAAGALRPIFSLRYDHLAEDW